MKTLLFIGWLSSFGADATTTAFALQNGGREAILTQSAAANAAILGSVGIGTGLAWRAYYDRHPKIATVIAIIRIGIHTGVAINNTRIAYR